MDVVSAVLGKLVWMNSMVDGLLYVTMPLPTPCANDAVYERR